MPKKRSIWESKTGNLGSRWDDTPKPSSPLTQSITPSHGTSTPITLNHTVCFISCTAGCKLLRALLHISTNIDCIQLFIYPHNISIVLVYYQALLLTASIFIIMLYHSQLVPTTAASTPSHSLHQDTINHTIYLTKSTGAYCIRHISLSAFSLQ